MNKVRTFENAKWQSAILPHGGIHLSIYAEQLSLKLISTLRILGKDNIYGAWTCIISKLPYIFIVTMKLILPIDRNL